MSGYPAAFGGLPSRPRESWEGALQGTGGDLGTWFEEVLGDLVASFGRVPVSAAVLVLAVVLGVFVVPRLVAAIRGAGNWVVVSERARPVVDVSRRLVPTTFSELVVRTVQVGILLVGAMALVVVWGYGDIVTDVRGSVASDLKDVFGLSLTMFLIAMAFVGSDLLEAAINRLGNRAGGFTDHQQEIALRVGQVTLFVTLGAAILTLWSFDLTGLLVGAGFLGIVVGFAARETLGSLIAGFVLMFSRPFTIGDWVEIGDAEGVITDITMFNTRMQNIDAESLVIPNDVVSNSTIVNRSRKGRLQIRREVGIDYDSDPDRACDVAVEAMIGVDDVIDSPAPKAVPVRFADSSIVLELRFWIKNPRPPRKWAAVAGVLSAVRADFEAEGIEIPFPQRTLSNRGGRGNGGDAAERSVQGDWADEADRTDVEEATTDGEGSGEAVGEGSGTAEESTTNGESGTAVDGESGTAVDGESGTAVDGEDGTAVDGEDGTATDRSED